MSASEAMQCGWWAEEIDGEGQLRKGKREGRRREEAAAREENLHQFIYGRVTSSDLFSPAAM